MTDTWKPYRHPEGRVANRKVEDQKEVERKEVRLPFWLHPLNFLSWPIWLVSFFIVLWAVTSVARAMDSDYCETRYGPGYSNTYTGLDSYYADRCIEPTGKWKHPKGYDDLFHDRPNVYENQLTK